MHQSRPEAAPTDARDRLPPALRSLLSARNAQVLTAISAGGTIGSLARYGVGQALPNTPGSFPWATFAVDVSGCLLIGVLVVLLAESGGRPHRLLRPFFGVGLLGGYTTFSAYAAEANSLLGRSPGMGLLYVVGTLLAALGAVILGAALTRLITRRLL
jgi:fluoride exporter